MPARFGGRQADRTAYSHNISVFPGESYYLSAYVATANSSRNIELYASFRSDTGASVDDIRAVARRPTSAWRKIGGMVKVPDGAHDMRFVSVIDKGQGVALDKPWYLTRCAVIRAADVDTIAPRSINTININPKQITDLNYVDVQPKTHIYDGIRPVSWLVGELIVDLDKEAERMVISYSLDGMLKMLNPGSRNAGFGRAFVDITTRYWNGSAWEHGWNLKNKKIYIGLEEERYSARPISIDGSYIMDKSANFTRYNVRMVLSAYWKNNPSPPDGSGQGMLGNVLIQAGRLEVLEIKR